MTFWNLVRADLHASTGHRSLRRAITAYLFNPSFRTVARHRLAAHLYGGRLRRLGIIVWQRNISRSGCHINLTSEIGPGLFLPHPTAVVIGAGVQVGPNATIFQSVTIGKTTKSEIYPSLGANVIVYPNAVIIGEISVGDHAVIGASSVVVKNVPAGAIVAGNPARILRVAPQTATSANLQPSDAE